MIPRESGGNEYLFMQDGACAHTGKLTLAKLGNQKQLKLLQPQMKLSSPRVLSNESV